MKSDISICSICGGDRNKDMSDIRLLCSASGLSDEICNPGGRELIFGDKRLQIGDMCNSCDENEIREFLQP